MSKKKPEQLELPIEKLPNSSVRDHDALELERAIRHRDDLQYQLNATNTFIEILKERKRSLEYVR